MKLPIFVLMLLTACTRTDACAYKVVLRGVAVTCHSGYAADCGVHMWDCDDGKTYLCVQGVQASSSCDY